MEFLSIRKFAIKLDYTVSPNKHGNPHAFISQPNPIAMVEPEGGRESPATMSLRHTEANLRHTEANLRHTEANLRHTEANLRHIQNRASACPQYSTRASAIQFTSLCHTERIFENIGVF